MAAKTDENVKYHIYIESQCLISVNSLGDALADLVCTYFVFNISYPKTMYATLIFL